MGDIYRLCTNAIAWLGEETSDSALAFNAIEAMATNERAHWDSSLNPSLNLSKQNVSSVVELFKRPWWHRTWVSVKFSEQTFDPMSLRLFLLLCLLSRQLMSVPSALETGLKGDVNIDILMIRLSRRAYYPFFPNYVGRPRTFFYDLVCCLKKFHVSCVFLLLQRDNIR